MKEISLNMTTIGVKSETKPLRVSWSQEMVQDLNYYQDASIDRTLEKEIEIILRIEKRKNSIKNIFTD